MNYFKIQALLRHLCIKKLFFKSYKMDSKVSSVKCMLFQLNLFDTLSEYETVPI